MTRRTGKAWQGGRGWNAGLKVHKIAYSTSICDLYCRVLQDTGHTEVFSAPCMSAWFDALASREKFDRTAAHPSMPWLALMGDRRIITPPATMSER